MTETWWRGESESSKEINLKGISRRKSGVSESALGAGK